MVQYNPKTWFNLIFHSYSRQVFENNAAGALLFMALFSALVCFVILDVFNLTKEEFGGSTVVHSLLGIVLGLFLVFRTNSAYDRWWEGRRLWGGIVNGTRNLALKCNAYLPQDDKESRVWFGKMIPNFVFITKEHLRQGVVFSELDPVDDKFIEYLRACKHRPNRAAGMMFSKVNELYMKKVLTGDHLINLDKELKDMMDLVGGCERIKNTPIPYSYSMYVKKFIFIYIITLPFGFITTFGYVSIIAVILVSFVLLSVELIAEEIEDPFGRDINDLPTDELATKIKDNIGEILLLQSSSPAIQ